MLQLLELLLVDGVHKELELSQLCPTNVPGDLFPTVTDKDDAVPWHENVKCMVPGISLELSAISCYTALCHS